MLPDTIPVGDVPVDGTVEVQGTAFGGRLGPWMRVIGEQQSAVGGQAYRSLLVVGDPQPYTWHLDAHVKVRPVMDLQTGQMLGAA